MLSTVPGITTAVPVGSASPLATPLEKLTDEMAAEGEDGVTVAVELWVLVDETWVEVGVLN